MHADQPVAVSQVWVPKQMPIGFCAEQVRWAPFISAEQLQLPVTGWQNLPAWPPVASATQR